MHRKPDLITRWFLATVMLGTLVYVCFGLTPSSYGLVLDILGAHEAGPALGSGRPIRTDEWSVLTPYFQAAVRNRFQRFNEYSFYHEDLRNFYPLPLEDWSLAFKPQLWAFFLLPPATAFSIYHALIMAGCLVGYHLLFRSLGLLSWLAAAASVIVYFSGFTQFWWTTYGPLIAGLPWVLLLLLQPMRWWTKALLCAWVFPTFVLSHVYPALLLPLAWGALILILAVRPSWLRSYGNIAAMVAGVLATAGVLALYFGDVIPVMRNTVFPGHRVGAPGTASIYAVLLQIFPFFAFRLGDFESLVYANVCELSTIGSFLPLLALCVIRYRDLRNDDALRKSLSILLTAFVAMTLWEIAPVPRWIGKVLLWDTGQSQRLLFTSGLLLMLAALLILRSQLLSLHPIRIVLFVLVGPVASLLLKIVWLILKGQPAEIAMEVTLIDILLCGFMVAAGFAACYIPSAARLPTLVIAIALANVFAFGRFNPLQPAAPIFQIPDTAAFRELRKQAAIAPGGVLVEQRFFGATLGGLGFRSVSHVLLAPKLSIFRGYFPMMDWERFNLIFNRYAHIQLKRIPLPRSPQNDVIEVPMEVFVPIRNVREVAIDTLQGSPCAHLPGGGIDRITAHGDQLDVVGWAPWVAETDQEGIRILSQRPLHASLATITRPDVAEWLQDYRTVKAGFRLQLSSADGKPLLPDDMALIAFGTSRGEIRLPEGRASACP